MSYNRPFLDLLASAGIVAPKGDKLPPEAQPERLATFPTRTGLVPLTLWVKPYQPGNKGHRVMARCFCGKETSAGRFHQHVKVHAKEAQ